MRKRITWIAAAAALALAPAARGAEKVDGRAAAAVELSRMVLSADSWKKTMKAAADQTAAQLAQMVQQGGGSLAPEFAAAFAEEFTKLVPYQEIADMQAGLLAKHYTEGEIRELLAFYRTPLGQKMIRAMPEIMADVSAWSMSIMQQRMGAVMERLKPLMKQPGEAAEPATEPAATPAR